VKVACTERVAGALKTTFSCLSSLAAPPAVLVEAATCQVAAIGR
jgi:hypothetical protein